MTSQAARPSLLRMLTSSTNPTDGPSKNALSTEDRPSPSPPAALAEQAILVRGLRCRYGPIEAVKGIDLEIMRGEIFALLGPNGAGKTTTIEILEGFRKRTGGDALVLDTDPALGGREWRGRIGVVLQESLPEPELTVRECVALYAGYYQRPRGVDETIALVGLAGLADRRGEQLSGGERRRLDVALALIGDPELIFLDEPTTGFDPSARRAAWEVIGGLRDLGKTVFLTTHYMEEAERLADRIAVIAAGRIVAEGTPQTLGGRQLEAARIAFTPPGGAHAADLPATLSERLEPDTGGRLRLLSTSVAADLHVLSGWALDWGLELDDLEVTRPTLEDVYLQLTTDHERS